MNVSQLLPLANEYCISRRIEVLSQPLLGHGADGAVFRTSRRTALKIVEREKSFWDELTCYERLKAAGVRQIGIFAVPSLEDFDERWLAIEMSIVDPPFLLDFGKVAIDRPPDYLIDPMMRHRTHAEWRQLFGNDWEVISDAIETLRTRFGIYYVDPKPSNINTGRIEDDDWMVETQPPPVDPDDIDDLFSN